ncbi:MAG: hypothetical protein K6F03_01525 [Saccharofermentans sp.]|nr:hypothetical protein [Saccharofermentans sp.]
MPVRKILKDTCILAALMILAVFTLSIIWSGVTAEISLVLALFGLALIITVVNFLFDEYLSLTIFLSYIIKYFVFSGIVMLFGFIAGWFFPSNFWMAFIYVGVVLALAFVIDAFTVKRDIGYINEHIRKGTGNELSGS